MTSNKPLRGVTYIATWLLLLILTGMSYGASLLEFGKSGSLNLVVALSIASIKALIVLFVFMHLIEASFTVRTAVLAAISFIIFLCLGIAGDVGFR